MLRLFVPNFLKLSGHTADLWSNSPYSTSGICLASSRTLRHANVDKCPISLVTLSTLLWQTFKLPLLDRKFNFRQSFRCSSYRKIHYKRRQEKSQKKTNFLPPDWITNRLWMNIGHTFLLTRINFTFWIGRIWRIWTILIRTICVYYLFFTILTIPNNLIRKNHRPV